VRKFDDFWAWLLKEAWGHSVKGPFFEWEDDTLPSWLEGRLQKWERFYGSAPTTKGVDM